MKTHPTRFCSVSSKTSRYRPSNADSTGRKPFEPLRYNAPINLAAFTPPNPISQIPLATALPPESCRWVTSVETVKVTPAIEKASKTPLRSPTGALPDEFLAVCVIPDASTRLRKTLRVFKSRRCARLSRNCQFAGKTLRDFVDICF
jgi:hypothetical protein